MSQSNKSVLSLDGSPARIFAIFGVLSLVLFSPMLSGWFQEDDYDILYHVASGGPFGMWTHAPTLFFRPLISLSFWLQHAIFGLNPIAYRIFNDLTHAGVATAVTLLLGEVVRDRRLALFGGLLFLVHPSHAETVNWIAGRTDLLSSLFGLLSLWAFTVYVRTHAAKAAIGSLVFLGAGLLCKESVLLVPLIALVYALCVRSKGTQSVLAGQFLLIPIYFFVRLALMGPALKGNLERASGGKLIAATLAEAVRAVLPGLPFGNPLANNVEALRSPVGILYMGVGVLLLGYLAYRLFAGGKLTNGVFLALAFVLALGPAAGLSVRLFRSQGERFVYLPSVFLLSMLAMTILVQAPERIKRPTNDTPMYVLLGSCFLLLQWQNLIWRQGAALSQRVQASYIRDVVDRIPPSTKAVALLDIPVAAQGSYGIAYALDSVTPLFRPDRQMHAEFIAAYMLRDSEDQVMLSRRGDHAVLQASGSAQFNMEATMTGKQKEFGFSVFQPQNVEIDLKELPPGMPVYYWTGAKFERVE